jgi:glutaminyl-peptide cyclotransferase
MEIRYISFLLIFLILSISNGCKDNVATSKIINKNIPTIDYKYVNSYPHDLTSFTEGFLIHDGSLFESTGATEEFPQTRSLFGIVDLKTGKIDIKVEIDKVKYFGEGIAFLNGKAFQLTYKTKVGFIYDAITFRKINEFTFPSDEGWGLTTDGISLIMSDGTNTLTYLGPDTFEVIKTISVSAKGYASNDLNLNELEYIKGFIYANLWMTNTIVKVNPTDGKVIGKLDLNLLAYDAKKVFSGSLEMNGIAYDSITDRIFVTGKFWPKIYEIELSY